MRRIYCKYCKEKLAKITGNSIYASCFYCNTDYYVNGIINIYCEIKGRIYYMQFNHRLNCARIIEDLNSECIAEFTTAPNITPSNIIKKLKLYLTFS